MIEAHSKLREGNFLKFIKGTYEKPTLNITLCGENQKAVL